MKRDESMSKIADLEREIAVLPEGSITKKKINNKEYYYHRITRNKGLETKGRTGRKNSAESKEKIVISHDGAIWKTAGGTDCADKTL